VTERVADEYGFIAARLAELAKERAAERETAREEELGAAHEPENAPAILQDWFPG
jgi:hypothetical protein